MKIIETKVLIIGAGPAGASAALFLAKSQISCVLVDKETFPRDKVCGDAISGKVVSVLKKIDPALVDKLSGSMIQLGSHGISFISPNNKSLRIPFKKDSSEKKKAPCFISKRIDFDNFLIQEVRTKNTIEFIENCQLRDSTKNEDGYSFLSKDGDFKINTKLVIACDGANSFFSKKVNNFSISNEENCFGLRAYYEKVDDLDADNFIELHFIKDLLPGYFWIFPLPNGQANVGLGMRADFLTKNKQKLPQLLEKVIALPQFKDRFKNAKLLDGIKMCSLPLGTKKRVLYGDNFLLCGDAAALIDPFTGEGIGNAMQSGMLAAQIAEKAIQEDNYSKAMLKTYDEQVYQKLGPELRISTQLHRLLMFPWLFNYVVNKATSNIELRNLICTMFEDIDLRAKFRDPKFYIKLLFN